MQNNKSLLLAVLATIATLSSLTAQTIPQPLQVVRVYNVTSASQVFDNRSTAAAGCNYYSYYVNSGTGSWATQLEYSDVSRTGPWTMFTTSQVTNTSFVPIGVGNGFHSWVRLNTTAGTTSATFSCSKDYFITSSASTISAVADPGSNCIPYRAGPGIARCANVGDISTAIGTEPADYFFASPTSAPGLMTPRPMVGPDIINAFGTQVSPYIFAAPASGNGPPSFRQGVASDLTFTQAGTHAVTETLDAALKARMVSVKDWGAKGDGTTDDKAAINNAITDASVDCRAVYFPAGTYMVLTGSTDSSGIVLKTCVSLYGDGRGSSIIKMKNSPMANILKIGTSCRERV